MTPGFALNLTHEGIGLLWHSPDGWQNLGDARLDDPGLEDRLREMRDMALAQETDALLCKLIIPNSEILYLECDIADNAQARETAEAALIGRTPYELDDLKIDWVRQGNRLQVAAVACETLTEAESFATEHQFNPVAFCASPESDAIFMGEPSFGDTSVARDILTAVEATEIPVVASQEPVKDVEPSTQSPAAPPIVEVSDGAPEMSPAQDPLRETPSLEETTADIPVMAPAIEKAETQEDLPDVTPEEISRPETIEVSPIAASETLAPTDEKKKPVVAILLSGAAAVALGVGFALWQSQPETNTDPAVIAHTDVSAPKDTNPASPPEPVRQPLPSQEDAEAFYAGTDIWLLPPDVGQYDDGTSSAPTAPNREAAGSSSTVRTYIPSHDPALLSLDALALPLLNTSSANQSLPDISEPAPAGTVFALNSLGLVVPTPEGTTTPDGIRLFAGRPDFLTPPRPPEAAEAQEEITAEDTVDLSELRPVLRPGNLAEIHERNVYGGLTRAELAAIRPVLRPESAQSAPEVDTTPTEFAVAVSLVPPARPANFQETVTAALEARTRTTPGQSSGNSASASASNSSARSTGPTIPTRASVARNATINNAIRLNRLSLVGVYKTGNTRRALMRTRNGRYRRVEVGDRIDGGRIAAIGNSSIQYVKGSRNVTMEVPGS